MIWVKTDFLTSVSGLSDTDGTGIITSSAFNSGTKLPYFSLISSDASKEVQSFVLL